jgi:hypothetical protein
MSDAFQHRSIHEADHIEALQQQIRELTRQRDDARDLAVRSGIFESVESTRPTLESARVVVETLRDENTRLLEQLRALTAANEDLNAELISLRRSLLNERDREGCE